jgi:VanZ family protein
MAKTWRQKITLILLALYWPALFFLAHVPIPQLVRKAGVSDKCLHFLAYLILTFLLWFSIKSDEKVKWRRPAVWCIIVLTAGYGAVDEVIQSTVGRTCDVLDIAANLAGILTGLFIFSFFTFWPSSLFVTGLTVFGITNIAKANLAEMFPVTYMLFHLFAFGIFTALWIQNMHLSIDIKESETKWLICAFSVPVGFLLTVKVFTAILGRDFAVTDIIASLGAIIIVTVAIYIRALLKKRRTSTTKPLDDTI